MVNVSFTKEEAKLLRVFLIVSLAYGKVATLFGDQDANDIIYRIYHKVKEASQNER